ncbi:MAG: DMT family transporter [Gammaproteobacteria bacterium]|jgi:drug/metabolite transporter (DMT)-like permease|nr:DMT family transporter [Gammaproteobacteria bacterium]NDA13625.1 DMT family transporter [Gammaproteobacteria bacterium]NDG43214.1 DMT family transporter [Gammaproteobacteria bacterium]
MVGSRSRDPRTEYRLTPLTNDLNLSEIKMTDRLKGLALSLGGIVLLSPDSLILRLINADVWTMVFWRGSLSALGLLVMIGLIERQLPLRAMLRVGAHGAWVALSFAVSALAFVFAILNTAVANALVIMSSSPLIAALLGFALFNQRTAATTWIAAMAIAIGLAIVFLGSLETGRMPGDLSAFAASCALAFCFVMIQRHREVSMLPSLAWSGILVSLIVLPLASPSSVAGQTFALTILLCLFIVPISMGMIALSPRYLSAPEVSLVMRLEVLLAPLWVWLVLEEMPSMQTLIGGAIIFLTLIALSIVTLRQGRRPIHAR